ncbi:MAG: hypothetical protein ABIF17_01705 [Patescibacteria group bacterium]
MALRIFFIIQDGYGLKPFQLNGVSTRTIESNSPYPGEITLRDKAGQGEVIIFFNREERKEGDASTEKNRWRWVPCKAYLFEEEILTVTYIFSETSKEGVCIKLDSIKGIKNCYMLQGGKPSQ